MGERVKMPLRAQTVDDLISEVGLIGDDYPNFAGMPVNLPCGHWRELADALEWRTIDSAPRDGSTVLVAHASNGAIFCAAWENDAWIDGATNSFDEPVEYSPSHWLPLPPAPAKWPSNG